MSDRATMPVVILAGGPGFRTREDIEFHPKTMVEIGDRPLLGHLVNSLKSQGHSEFIVCVGSKGNEIRSFFSNFFSWDASLKIDISHSTIETEPVSPSEHKLNVTVLETGKLASTGTRLRSVKDFVGDRTFLCVYGDVIANVPIGELIRFHRAHTGVATLTAVHPKSRFSVLEISSIGGIDSISDTPTLSSWINGGYYIFEPSIFSYLDDDFPFEDSPLENLVEEKNIYAYQHNGFWHPVDTQRDVDSLTRLYQSGSSPWNLE